MVPAVPPAVTPSHRQAPRRRHPVRAYFANIKHAVTSTFEGMSVTMSWMFRRPATVQYPDKIDKPVQEMLPDNYRGVLELDVDRCAACLLCAKACPLGCISIEVCKNQVTGNRDMTKFDIDIGLCMYCGFCAEACNFDALDHTTEFEATVTDPKDLVLKFVPEGQPHEISKLKAVDMPPRKPKGSILAQIIPSFGRRDKSGDLPKYAAQDRTTRAKWDADRAAAAEKKAADLAAKPDNPETPS